MRIIPLAGACLVTGLLFASPGFASPIAAADAPHTSVVSVGFDRAMAATSPGARELHGRLKATVEVGAPE